MPHYPLRPDCGVPSPQDAGLSHVGFPSPVFGPPVMVTAWSAKTRMALANTLAPGNIEAAGALQLIELLCLKGCVVTMDALRCRRDTAQAIVDARGRLCAGREKQPAGIASKCESRHRASRAQAGQEGHDPRRRSWPQGSPHRHRGSGKGSGRTARLPGPRCGRPGQEQAGPRQDCRALLPAHPALQARRASQHRAPALERRWPRLTRTEGVRIAQRRASDPLRRGLPRHLPRRRGGKLDMR